MPTRRGLLVTLVAGSLAGVGRRFGVEEFLIVAVAAGVLVLLGGPVAELRGARASRALAVEVRPASMEVVAGDRAAVEVRLVNNGTRRLGAARMTDPAGCWRRAAGSEVHAPPTTTGHVPLGKTFRFLGSWVARSSPSLTIEPMEPAGGGIVVEVEVPTGARGELVLEGLVVWCEDPFRMFALPALKVPPVRVLVLPRAGVVPAQHGSALEAMLEGDLELAGLRPSVQGDRVGLLHWPSLARGGPVAARDFVPASVGDLLLVLDARAGVHSDSSLENAVETAAAIGLAALAAGATIVLAVTGRAATGLPAHRVRHERPGSPSAGPLRLQPTPSASRQLLRELALVEVAEQSPAASGGAGVAERAGVGVTVPFDVAAVVTTEIGARTLGPVGRPRAGAGVRSVVVVR